MTGKTTSAPARRRITTAAATAAVLALALAPAALAADPETITFVSDTSWQVSDPDGAVGPSLSLPAAAQAVCLNASAPSPCPDGATQYGWGGGGWATDLSGIPGARWIWAPGIDGSTVGADSDNYLFAKTITVPGTPVSGTIWVAVDDSASVGVNDQGAGNASGNGALTEIDITALLQEGDNLVYLRGRNGDFGNPGSTYQQNPAGIVFGGEITYTPADSGPSDDPAPSDDGGDGEVDDDGPSISMPPTDTAMPVAPASGGDGASVLLLVAGLLAAACAVPSLAVTHRRRTTRGDDRG